MLQIINFVIVTGGSSRDAQLLEMDETTTQKQEQATMQTERELLELEEREQDIRQLEVTFFTFLLYQVQSSRTYAVCA